MDTRNLVIGGALLLLTASTWWLSRQSPLQEQRPERASTAPDYYLVGFAELQYNAEGVRSQRLAALRLTHYPGNDSTDLSAPRIRMYDGERPPWRVKAESGWLSGDGEVLLLNGRVDIDRSASGEALAAHIDTRNLKVQPKQNYIETDEAVVYVSGKDRVNAVGMQAWFNEPTRMKLLSKVRGHHDVQ
ncbi:MAG: LPS export ABC transporter periplasmic protein LptC [Candidatus Sedimenticola endophacoides]